MINDKCGCGRSWRFQEEIDNGVCAVCLLDPLEMARRFAEQRDARQVAEMERDAHWERVKSLARLKLDAQAELAALRGRIEKREAAWRHTKNENLVAASQAASDGNKRVFNRDASDCAIIELELRALLETPKSNERPTLPTTHPLEDDFGHPV